jgi:hypothetical protein
MVIWISLLHIDLKPVRNSSERFGRVLARKDGALNVRCTLHMRFFAFYIFSFKTLLYTGIYYVEFWKDMGQYVCSETHSLLSIGYQGLIPGGKVAGTLS